MVLYGKSSSRLFTHYWPMVILVAAVFVLQYHGIKFWMESTGKTGIAWSLLLDGAGLWLWSRRGFVAKSLAITASLLTLVGPLYQVGYLPLQSGYQGAQQLSALPEKTQKALQAKAQNIALLEAERGRLEASLRTYQSNSTERQGWLPAIESTSKRLLEVNQSLLALNEQEIPESTVSAVTVTGNFFIVGMQLFSLVLFQLVSIICVLQLSNNKEDEVVSTDLSGSKDAASREISTKEMPAKNKETRFSSVASNEAKNDKQYQGADIVKTQNLQAVSIENSTISPIHYPSPTVIDDKESDGRQAEDIDVVLNQYIDYLDKHQLSQSAFSKKFGISAKELSFLRNHHARVAAGQRTISAPCLEQLRQVLVR